MVAFSKRLERKQSQIERQLSKVYKRIPKLVRVDTTIAPVTYFTRVELKSEEQVVERISSPVYASIR